MKAEMLMSDKNTSEVTSQDPSLSIDLIRRCIFLSIPSWCIIVLLRIQSKSFVGDDAYMTFRVARNLLHGNGFVYNIGEAVQVSTTPLWVLVITFFSWVFSQDPASVYRYVSPAVDLLCILLLVAYASNKGRAPLRGFAAGLLYALSWHANLSSTIGMEPGLFVALMLGALLLYQYGKLLWLSFVLAGLAFMTRPEGAFLVIAFALVRVISLRRIPWAEVLPVGILLSLYLAWMQWYFGSMLPHAGMAKRIAYYREPLQAFQGLSDHVVMLTLTPFFDDRGFFAGVLPYVLWMLSLVGFVVTARRDASFAILGIFTFSVLALYTLTNPLMFEWYVVPLEPGYIASLVFGVCWLAAKLKGGATGIHYRALTTALLALVCFFGVLRYELPGFRIYVQKGAGGGYRWWPLFAAAPPRWYSPLPLLGPMSRESIYIRIAQMLAHEVHRDTVILAPEYGALGYHSEAKMLSSIGHTSKEMFQFLPVPREQVGKHINNSISTDMVEYFKPDYVVSLETFIRVNLLRSPKFKQEYELVKKFPSPVFGSQGIYVFRRIASE